MALFISLILSDKPIAALMPRPARCFDRLFRVRARIQEFLPGKLSGLSEIDVHLGGRGRTLFNRERYVHRANVNGRYSLTSSYLSCFPVDTALRIYTR